MTITKYCTVLFCCFVACITTRAQTTTDSISGALRQHPQQDSIRLELLNRLGAAYTNDAADSGILVATEAITLAQHLHLPEKEAAAWRNKALHYHGLQKDSLSLDASNRALSIARQLHLPLLEAKTLHAMGLVYNSESEYYKAIDCHSRALALFHTIHDDTGMAGAANSIGTNYLFLGNYTMAIQYYQQALSVYRKQGNNGGTGLVLSNLAIVYRRMSKPLKAIEYSREALHYHEQNGNTLARANILSNIANVYDDMDSTALALAYYRQSLQLHRQLHNTRGIASVYLNMGIVYNGTKDAAHAFLYLEKGRALYEQLGDKNSLAIAWSELGKASLTAPATVLQQQHINPANRYAAAIADEQRALQLATAIASVDNQRDIWQYLSEAYEAQGNSTKALAAYKQYVLLKDSVLNDEAKENILRLTMQYEHEKKQAALQAAFEKQQNTAVAAIQHQRLVTMVVLGSAVVLLVTALLGFRLYKRKRDARALQLDAERRSQIAEVEMKALRSQLNPHFIFNSLNAISDYLRQHQTGAADEYLVRFARLMRLILENADHREIPLEDDLTAMRLYMQLETLRLQQGFNFHIEVDEALDTARILVPPLILQPLVENSIWHGIARKTGGGGLITIRICKQNDTLLCTVEDNGAGRINTERNGSPRRKSYGMQLTASRIALLSKTTDTATAITITDLQPGTRVSLVLPLIETD